MALPQYLPSVFNSSTWTDSAATSDDLQKLQTISNFTNANPWANAFFWSYPTDEGLGTKDIIALGNEMLSDPKKFANENKGTIYMGLSTDAPENQSAFTNFLISSGVSTAEINKTLQTVAEDTQRIEQGKAFSGGGFGDVIGGLFNNPITQVALAYYLPGVGAAIGTQLGVSAAVGTALASTAVQVANGVDFDTAIKNATVNAIVSTGSQDVAKDINAAIKNPDVTNALASVGGSIVKTAATGGNAQDIVNNATAALVGSGVSSATGDKTLGAAAGGAVTGGTVGALTGAAGALAPKETDTKTPVASADQQVIDAFTKSQASTDLASLIDNANLTPEERDFLKQAQQSTFTAASTAQALPSTTTDVGAGTARLGSPFAANDPRFISALQKNPELISKFSEYTNSYGFNTPELNVVYKGLLEQELQKDPTYQPFLDEYKKVTGKDYELPSVGEITITASKKDAEKTPDSTYTPTIVSPGDVTVARPTTPAATPVTLPSTAPATLPNTAPITAPTTGVETTPVTTPATSSAATPTTTTPTQAPTTPPSFVTVDTTVDKGGDEPTTTKTIDKTPLDTKKDTTDTKTDTAPITDTSTTPATPIVSTQAKPYSPELFIYGGGSPSTLSRSLGTEIQAPYYPGAAAQGLTAERGAGEIEGTETGKKRKNVWNEASLRLKDALGL